jgi:DNA-binding transcriptional LysR family regulator
MDTDLLRAFREVARRGSFTAAAEALQYTQSAVSRQVATLEAAAGRQLFERRHDGARLTPAGSRLLARATTVLAELDAARRELEANAATQFCSKSVHALMSVIDQAA